VHVAFFSSCPPYRTTRSICSKGEVISKTQEKLFFQGNFCYHAINEGIRFQGQKLWGDFPRGRSPQEQYLAAVARAAAQSQIYPDQQAAGSPECRNRCRGVQDDDQAILEEWDRDRWWGGSAPVDLTLIDAKINILTCCIPIFELQLHNTNSYAPGTTEIMKSSAGILCKPASIANEGGGL
jgi:hypothetical protein